MRKVKNNAVIQAMLIGSITGIMGVLLFVFLLQMPTTTPGSEPETIPVQTTEEEQKEEVIQVFYALQHGVFSSFESATQLVASFPTLNKAAVVKVDDQYFVWSRIDIEKVESALTVVPSAFYKKFTLQSSCPNPAQLQLPKTLKDTKLLTLQDVVAASEGGIPDDWKERVEEVTKLSTNPNVIRLHLLNNYYEQSDCMKITF